MLVGGTPVLGAAWVARSLSEGTPRPGEGKGHMAYSCERWCYYPCGVQGPEIGASQKHRRDPHRSSSVPLTEGTISVHLAWLFRPPSGLGSLALVAGPGSRDGQCWGSDISEGWLGRKRSELAELRGPWWGCHE